MAKIEYAKKDRTKSENINIALTEAATGSVLYKKNVLENFAKFTGKHLYQSLFFTDLTRLFPCEFCETFKSTFFTEHLQATASAFTSKYNNRLLH